MSEWRTLASGRVVEVGDDGRATFLTCEWLVRVASGNPEPDSIEDTYRDVPCGAPLRAANGRNLDGGYECAAGHHFYGYEVESRLSWEQEQIEREREGFGIF